MLYLKHISSEVRKARTVRRLLFRFWTDHVNQFSLPILCVCLIPIITIHEYKIFSAVCKVEKYVWQLTGGKLVLLLILSSMYLSVNIPSSCPAINLWQISAQLQFISGHQFINKETNDFRFPLSVACNTSLEVIMIIQRVQRLFGVGFWLQ